MFLIFPLLFATLICISEQSYYEEAYCSLLPGVKCTPFKSAFSKELAKSNALLNQFDVTLKPNEATIEFYNDTLKFFTKLGASDPVSIAEKLAHAARYKFNGITPNTYAAMVATVVERFLKKEKILTNKNAASLAKTYVKFLNKARIQPGRDGSSASNLFSLCDGTTNLLFAVTELTPKKIDRFGRFAIQGYSSLPVQSG